MSDFGGGRINEQTPSLLKWYYKYFHIFEYMFNEYCIAISKL